MSPRTPRGAAARFGTYGIRGTNLWRRGRFNRQPPTANRQPQTANALTADPSKPDLRPIDLGASLDEELFQGRGVKRAVLFGIHSQENLAAGLEEPFL